MDIKTDYQFEEGLDVTPEVQRSFDEKGYITVRSLLNDGEMTKLRKAIEHNKGILKHHFNVGDGHGRNLGHVMWSHPGNDITGMIARSEKVGGFIGKLLGGEVYHYHSKMIMKSAKTGGRFNWHQDYGYWYNYCLYPNMGSVFIAFDKCDKENGCLQIIPGSHKMGRVDHVKIQDQTGADMKRVEFAKQKLGLLHVELDAGDALFFHSNVLHSSSPNNSDRRRWSFIMCYNRKDNDPIKVHHHPSYTPMQIVPNSAIMECPDEVDLTGKDFLNPREHEAVPFQEEENGETKAKKPKRRLDTSFEIIQAKIPLL